MVSEKVHIANVLSLTRRPKPFVKFTDGVGQYGRAGSSRKSNELSDIRFPFYKIFNPTRGRMESYCKCTKLSQTHIHSKDGMTKCSAERHSEPGKTLP
jgi:hypothetical protein